MLGLVVWLVFELSHTLPKQHLSKDDWRFRINDGFAEAINKASSLSDRPIYELRGNDANGKYVGFGLATINNGVSAIMPTDQRLNRTTLFHTKYVGYWPAELTLTPWSWQAVSANLMLVDTTPRSNRDWNKAKYNSDITPTLLLPSNIVEIERETVIFISGKTLATMPLPFDSTVWLHFQGNHHDFWVEGNVGGQSLSKHSAKKGNHILDWRIRIPNNWVEENKYQVKIRLEHLDTGTHADSKAFDLILKPRQLNSPLTFTPNRYARLDNATLLSATDDEIIHFYLLPDALPRAYIAKQCYAGYSLKQTSDFLKQSDSVIKGVVTLNEEMSAVTDFCQSYQAELKRIPIESDTGSDLKLESVKGPALITLNDYHYPGWHAKDIKTDTKLEILKANGIFRAILLPDNKEYQIQFSYRPWWLSLVYGLFVLACLLAFFGWRWLKSISQR